MTINSESTALVSPICQEDDISILMIMGFVHDDEFLLSGGVGYSADNAIKLSFVETGVRDSIDHHARFVELEHAIIAERINCELAEIDDEASFAYRVTKQATQSVNQRRLEHIQVEVRVKFEQASKPEWMYLSHFWFDIKDVW